MLEVMVEAITCLATTFKVFLYVAVVQIPQSEIFYPNFKF
jgi:hypothetical protein